MPGEIQRAQFIFDTNRFVSRRFAEMQQQYRDTHDRHLGIAFTRPVICPIQRLHHQGGIKNHGRHTEIMRQRIKFHRNRSGNGAKIGPRREEYIFKTIRSGDERRCQIPRQTAPLVYTAAVAGHLPGILLGFDTCSPHRLEIGVDPALIIESEGYSGRPHRSN